MRIYHNPRCTKSRQTLALIEQSGVKAEIVEYLEAPPTEAELAALLKKLGMAPEQLVRKGEEVYKKKFKDKKLSDAEWITAMVQNPILIERPIVVSGNRAVLGRPPENVRALL